MPLICRLCDERPPIKHSHIMPRFGYRYTSDKSKGGSYVELLTLTEKTKQLTRPWFCSECEKLFGESYAADYIAQLEKDRHKTQYSGQLLRFAVSFAWRATMFDVAEGGQSAKKSATLAEALARWKKFLRGEVTTTTPFTQHGFVWEPESAPWDGRMGVEVSYPNNLVVTQIGPLILFSRLKRQKIGRWETNALRLSRISKDGGALAVLSKSEINHSLTPAMTELLHSAATFCRVMGREFETRQAKRKPGGSRRKR
jgi:hypothetical protein